MIKVQCSGCGDIFDYFEVWHQVNDEDDESEEVEEIAWYCDACMKKILAKMVDEEGEEDWVEELCKGIEKT